MAEAGSHARHDPLDVAAATDRGASLPMTLGLCARCLDLYAELASVIAALPLAAVPRRPREFTLSAADAGRLRSRRWRRLLLAFGSARDEISRPLAVGFMTLGIVGLVLTAAPTVLPMTGFGGGQAASEVPLVEMGLEPATASEGPDVQSGNPQPGDEAPRDARLGVPSNGAGPLLLVSGAFLGVGGGLFAGRALARRRASVR